MTSMREGYLSCLPDWAMRLSNPVMNRDASGGEIFGARTPAMCISKDATMKADTHPQYHFIEVVMTDGTKFMTRSTMGKANDKLNLDIDPLTHPAWTGGSQQLMDRGGRLSKFNSRFAGLSFGKK